MVGPGQDAGSAGSGPLPWSRSRRRLAEELLRRRGLAKRSPLDAPRDGRGHAPLTFNQEGLWFIDRMHPGTANFSIPGAIRLRGALDVRVLERAIGEVVRRHDVLRTTFVEVDGSLRQVVAPPGAWTLRVVDLSRLPVPACEAVARGLLRIEAGRPFDLARGPLFRADLLALAGGDHVLSVNFHHIIADGWSMGVFLEELDALYRAAAGEAASRPPELPAQFSDFARAERAEMGGDAGKRLLEYWRACLAPPLPVLRLPTDRPRPAVQSFRGRHALVALPGALTRQASALARELGASLYMVLLAAFKVLLHGMSAQHDVIVGATFANRLRSEADGLIGFFANTLPLRTDLSGSPPFVDVVARVRDAVLGAHEHQSLPFAKLVQHLAVERESSRNPIFQVVFDVLTPDRNPAVFGYGLGTGAGETRRLGPTTATPIEIEGDVARFDLAAFLWDTPAGVRGALEYSTDLFDDATVSVMIRDYEAVLRRVVREPEVDLARASEVVTRTVRPRVDAGPDLAALRGALSRATRKPIPRQEMP